MRPFLIFVVLTVVACKANFQDMSGGTGTKKDKAGAKSDVAEKEESLAYGNEITKDTGKGKEAKSDGEDGDTDGSEDQAIAPESIAAAYLACDFAAENPAPNEKIYACAVMNAQERVTMKGFKQSWRLMTPEGVTVETKDYPIDATADKAWVVAKAVSDAGFVAELTMIDNLGETHVLKTQCGCTVTTPI